jgi:hypothetical protein
MLNKANIILLRKKEEAAVMGDYRPISLINSVAKNITKILATCLAPHLDNLVSNAQNAFIRKRCIRDNFIYAQRVIQTLHKKNKPALFVKLDISKAFDSISWPYLLEVLQALGFSQKWRDWISSLLRTSSSRVPINGKPGNKINHGRRLRQGDPLSPMLFILAIDPLQRLIDLAAKKGFLHPVLPKTATLRCSLYADDAAIFAAPNTTELDDLQKIIHVFGECSVNMVKTEIFPIRVELAVVTPLLWNFPGKINSFPGKYLGLPLHIRKLRKVDLQPLIDKIGARLPEWQGKLLSSA